MTVKLLLDAKREGRELAAEDIRALIGEYTRGEVPDYQMAAFAMAVCCRGMTDAETAALTEAMRLSGRTLDWTGTDPRPTADKHSTGGVGDKLSMIIQPLAASCGLRVPSLTGRGLGLTGGTADKLESIPGYDAALPLDRLQEVTAACGCAMTVATAEIAPADRKLYALRDVTGTVPSIPLIVASILSKKLAEGAETLVFDVKWGRGAFMKTAEAAHTLARALVAGAQAAGRKSTALVTDMNDPLGYAVGNGLEIRESIRVLKMDAAGYGTGTPLPADIIDLSVEFAAQMVSLAKGIGLEAARGMCRENLENGAAWRVFEEMVRLQGGDLAAFETRYAETWAGGEICYAPATGRVASIDAEKVAQTAFELGAGRGKSTDEIDPAAGVELLVKAGDRVTAGQPVARLYAERDAARLESAAKGLESAFEIA